MGDPSHGGFGDRKGALRPSDERLLDALRGALQVADPEPDHLSAGARLAFSLHELPVEEPPAPRVRRAAARGRRGR